MSRAVLSNNAESVLAFGIAKTDAFLLLNSPLNFPVLQSGEYYYATIDDGTGGIEIVLVQSSTGARLNILRGRDGTAPREFQGGARVSMNVNAALLRELAPLTGEGTSGTWPINVAGSAHAVGSVTEGQIVQSVNGVAPGPGGNVVLQDTAPLDPSRFPDHSIPQIKLVPVVVEAPPADYSRMTGYNVSFQSIQPSSFASLDLTTVSPAFALQTLTLSLLRFMPSSSEEYSVEISEDTPGGVRTVVYATTSLFGTARDTRTFTLDKLDSLNTRRLRIYNKSGIPMTSMAVRVVAAGI